MSQASPDTQGNLRAWRDPGALCSLRRGRPGTRVVSIWTGTRVLFTGAQGFIGSWVTERLLDEGHKVLTLDRPPAEPSRFRECGLHLRCIPVAADLLDVESLRSAIEQHDVHDGFHLAATAV